jgi:hypothetical protein
MKDKEQSLSDKKQSKKAYRQPQLQVYGDLRNITQTVGMNGAMDTAVKMALDKTR